MDLARGRKVLMGTCGWSDQTLLRCGKFYPAFVRSAEDRLRHYSQHFPCVEVDTSTYSIPSPYNVGRWVNAVIPGFLFHFKAFGLFCSKSGALSTIPYRVRSKLPSSDDQHVKLYDLPSEIRDELWEIFNSALQPAFEAGRLGVVVFQFHLSFKPSEEHRAHVLWCRKNLDSRYSMAVEFRSRDWFLGEQMSKTDAWLASNSLTLVAADELQHETFQRDREQTGLAPGQLRAVLPVAWPSTHQDFLYIRVHRREGTQRLLSDEELKAWEMRLGPQLPPGLKGPIYFMWGTDWEDQPMINAKRLSQRLPMELIFDWKSTQKTNNRLQSMFTAVSSKVQHSEKPDQARKHAEDSRCPAPTTELVESPADTTKSVPGNSSALMDENPSLVCASSDQSADEPQASPCTPLPPSDLSLCQKPADNEIVPSDRQLEGKLTDEDDVSRKRVTLSTPAPQVDGADGSVFIKSVPAKATQFSPVKKKFKKATPAKKSQTATATPTITSFFKRTASTDS